MYLHSIFLEVTNTTILLLPLGCYYYYSRNLCHIVCLYACVQLFPDLLLTVTAAFERIVINKLVTKHDAANERQFTPAGIIDRWT